MEGINQVKLQGFLQSPSLTKTKTGKDLFKGKVAVPYIFRDYASGEEKQAQKYFEISAWEDVAASLGCLPEGTPVMVEGEFSKRQYDATCRSCASPEKRYWTEVVVRGFEVVSE